MNRDHASLATRRRVEAAWVVVIALAIALGMWIGFAWGSSPPDGTHTVPTTGPSPAVVERLERGAACRCADRSVDQ